MKMNPENCLLAALGRCVVHLGTVSPRGKSSLRITEELGFIFISSQLEKGFRDMAPGKGKLGILFTSNK